jgi:hypothetical protein
LFKKWWQRRKDIRRRRRSVVTYKLVQREKCKVFVT